MAQIKQRQDTTATPPDIKIEQDKFLLNNIQNQYKVEEQRLINIKKEVKEAEAEKSEYKSLKDEIKKLKEEKRDKEKLKTELDALEDTIKNKKAVKTIIKVETDYDYTELNAKKSQLKTEISELEGVKQNEENNIVQLKVKYQEMEAKLEKDYIKKKKEIDLELEKAKEGIQSVKEASKQDIATLIARQEAERKRTHTLVLENDKLEEKNITLKEEIENNEENAVNKQKEIEVKNRHKEKELGLRENAVAYREEYIKDKVEKLKIKFPRDFINFNI